MPALGQTSGKKHSQQQPQRPILTGPLGNQVSGTPATLQSFAFIAVSSKGPSDHETDRKAAPGRNGNTSTLPPSLPTPGTCSASYECSEPRPGELSLEISPKCELVPAYHRALEHGNGQSGKLSSRDTDQNGLATPPPLHSFSSAVCTQPCLIARPLLG